MTETDPDNMKFRIDQLEASNAELMKRMVKLTNANMSMFQAVSRMVFKSGMEDQVVQDELKKVMQWLS